MRIAVISDIHGNLTALEAVISDLRDAAPDLVLHGGDLALGGARPAEVIDGVRELGWAGVYGNADEALTRPQALADFRASAPVPLAFELAIWQLAGATHERVGPERQGWLASLPQQQSMEGVALVHAKPGDIWRSPGADASDKELAETYSSLGCRLAVYAHIHRPYVCYLPGLTVANTGSLSLSCDRDLRAAYLLVTDGRPEIRRVDYAMELEFEALKACGLPHADWLMRMLVRRPNEMPWPQLGWPVR